MGFRKQSRSAKHCGLSRSVFREGLSAQHLDLTLIELLTLSLAVLNGFMYFLWWHKPLDVRCPVRVYLRVLDEPNDSNVSNVSIPDQFKTCEYIQLYWSLDNQLMHPNDLKFTPGFRITSRIDFEISQIGIEK